MERIRDLNELNLTLQRNLKQNAKDFKQLLAELDLLRRDVKGKDEQIRNLEDEVRLRPTLAQTNAQAVKFEHLSVQHETLRVENDGLHREIMMLRNQTKSHYQGPASSVGSD